MEIGHLQRVRMLYKLIFKLHRGLAADLQALGDNYTRDEFKRHKNCNDYEAAQFMIEWTNYALTLSHQLDVKKKKPVGRDLSVNQINELSDDQVQQLYELMLASKNVQNVQTEGNT